MSLKKYDVQPTGLLGEFVGTFVLALVAISVGNPIIVGFTLVVLVLALGAVSGAHLNPAVTFGLWSVKKINTVKGLFYWVSQIAGALLALTLVQFYQGGDYGVSLASFGQFDGKIVLAELLGAAIFTFAIAGAVQQKLADAARGLAIGFGLLAALTIGGGLIAVAAQQASPTQTETPRVSKVDGVVINPAIALAVNEKSSTMSQLSLTQGEQKPAEPASRFGLETIVGALVGGALGFNLYAVAAGVNPFEKKGVKASLTRVVKKSEKKVKKAVKKAKK